MSTIHCIHKAKPVQLTPNVEIPCVKDAHSCNVLNTCSRNINTSSRYFNGIDHKRIVSTSNSERASMLMHPVGVVTYTPFPNPWTEEKQPMPPRWPSSKQSADIKQLIDDALAVQDGLNAVKQKLANLEHTDETKMMVIAALNCQDDYYSLLTDSRDSASVLMAHLNDFTQNVVPLVRSAYVTSSDKIIEVRISADTIAHAAQNDPRQIEKRFAGLQNQMKAFQNMVTTYSKELKEDTQIPIDNLLTDIEYLEAKILSCIEAKRDALGRAFCAMMETSATTDRAAVLKIIAEARAVRLSAVTTFIQKASTAYSCIEEYYSQEKNISDDTRTLERVRRELDMLRRDLDSKQDEVIGVQRKLMQVMLQLDQLDGKLGNFQSVWNKLFQDVGALHEYLTNPQFRMTEKEFETRIADESVVYRDIRDALETYAIKAQRS